ncbi:MAG: hypothetical protein AAFV53_37265 [Myxococcota bacterium]
MRMDPHCPVPRLHRHNPYPRSILCEQGGWQVRMSPRNHSRHHQMATTGRLTLQLWHPERALSVLLPTPSTDNHYEIFPVNGHVLRIRCYGCVRHWLDENVGLLALPPKLVTGFYMRFVLAAMIGASPPRC